MLPRRSKSDVDLKKSERPLKKTRNDFSCHVEEEDPLFIDNEILRLEGLYFSLNVIILSHTSCNWLLHYFLKTFCF